MDFTNEFAVDAPIATVWEFMQNAEEVAPCVPGAAITEQVDDTHYRGTVKVKLGAVQMSYRGELELVPNESDRTIVLHAKGRETRGSGGASGTVTTRLEEVADGRTRVEIHSQIDVTGKVAQFGRGIMQDVANRLIKDFAGCLEQKITAGASPPGVATEPTGDTSVSTDTEPVPAAPSSTPLSSGPAEANPVPPTAAPSSHAPSGASSGDAASAVRQPESGTGSASASGADVVASRESPPAGSANELRISQLVLDIFRSRAAGWLRSAANRIEPK